MRLGKSKSTFVAQAQDTDHATPPLINLKNSSAANAANQTAHAGYVRGVTSAVLSYLMTLL